MDKHQQISVKINGKEQPTYTQKNQKDLDPINRSYPEFAAALDNQESQDEPQDNDSDEIVKEYEVRHYDFEQRYHEASNKEDDTSSGSYTFDLTEYERSYKPRKKNNFFGLVVKRLFLSIISASVVGLLLGFLMLRLFAGIDKEPINGQAQETMGTVNTSQTAGQEGAVSATNDTNPIAVLSESELPTVSAYVIQLGIFSSEEKAKIMQQQVMEKGFPSMIWQQNDQYYLFGGIGSSKDETKQMAEALKAEDIEIFVKDWHTAKHSLRIHPQEAKWMTKAMEQWKQLSIVTTNLVLLDNVSSDEIETQVAAVLNEAPSGEEFANINEFKKSYSEYYQSLQDYKASPSTKNLWQMQMSLLQIWRQYEIYLEH